MSDISKTISRIKLVSENIFESDAQCLVNTVNTVGVMGKGIALDFKKLYPDMFTFYKKSCLNKTLRIGEVLLWTDERSSKQILLFPTKLNWKNPSHIEYIDLGLQNFVKKISRFDFKSIAFPKLGCGLGGLDWDNHVHPLMEKYLNEVNLDVRIHV